MIKSQDELNTCNEGKRGSEVLLAIIEKCEALEKENERLKELLKECKEELNEFNYPQYSSVQTLLSRINAAIGESEE